MGKTLMNAGLGQVRVTISREKAEQTKVSSLPCVHVTIRVTLDTSRHRVNQTPEIA